MRELKLVFNSSYELAKREIHNIDIDVYIIVTCELVKLAINIRSNPTVQIYAGH